MAASTQAKNFLITGAGRGIGRGLSRLLLQADHRVLLVDNNQSELAHTASRLSDQFPEDSFRTMSINLRDEQAAFFVAHEAGRFFGGVLHVLINNAADTSSVGGTAFEDLSLDAWTSALETNLTAPMLLSQRCLELFRRAEAEGEGSRGTAGCIINMSSTRAFMSEPNSEPYAATKAGLLGLTQCLAVSLAPRGVRVNAILPGWIHVGNECREADEKGQKWEDGLSKEDHAWHLTGRVGKVEDIFRAVMYLVENEGVSGAEMVVDGGVTRKMVYPE